LHANCLSVNTVAYLDIFYEKSNTVHGLNKLKVLSGMVGSVQCKQEYGCPKDYGYRGEMSATQFS